MLRKASSGSKALCYEAQRAFLATIEASLRVLRHSVRSLDTGTRCWGVRTRAPGQGVGGGRKGGASGALLMPPVPDVSFLGCFVNPVTRPMTLGILLPFFQDITFPH